jgi:predicted alpha/beta superfamily hydrolase
MTPIQALSLRVALLIALCMQTHGFAHAGIDPAAQPPSMPVTAEVSIPNTRKIEFVSAVNQHRYSISIALPFEPPPAAGYNVLYVLDANLYFASAVEAIRDSVWLADTVIVGVGYPEDSAFSDAVFKNRGPVASAYAKLSPARAAFEIERLYDLSLPATDAELAAQTLVGRPPMKSANVGGLDNFLKTIELEVKPRVAALARINPGNQALFGHSLAGLATLHALFVEPKAFRTFVIASPSIWWNKRAVLADESQFAAAVRSHEVSPRVLVTIGSAESTAPAKIPSDWAITRKQLAEYLGVVRMVDNARDLVTRLKAVKGDPAYVVEDFVVFDKFMHDLSAWPALARGIPFAFQDPPKNSARP